MCLSPCSQPIDRTAAEPAKQPKSSYFGPHVLVWSSELEKNRQSAWNNAHLKPTAEAKSSEISYCHLLELLSRDDSTFLPVEAPKYNSHTMVAKAPVSLARRHSLEAHRCTLNTRPFLGHGDEFRQARLHCQYI